MLRIGFARRARVWGNRTYGYRGWFPSVWKESSESGSTSSIDAAVDLANQEISSFFGETVHSIQSFTAAPGVTTKERQQSSLFELETTDKSGEGSPPKMELSHVDASGAARMVDTSHKEETFREAGASVRVLLGAEAFQKVRENQIQKGDVLTVSKLAGIMGAKQTSTLLPLCHPISLSHVDVSFALDEDLHQLVIRSRVNCTSGTGVEMEALTAAGIAALNVIDMIKAVNKEAVITDLHLDFKRGGKSGIFERKQA